MSAPFSSQRACGENDADEVFLAAGASLPFCDEFRLTDCASAALQADASHADSDHPKADSTCAPQAYSVSEAMALARGALEGVRVRVAGEVSEVSNKPGYKAVYFTIKDEKAALPCMMWVNRYRLVGFQLAVGQMLELSGRFTLYAPKGRMNFDVLSLELAGEGKLRMKVADLARRLEAEGLMAPERKRTLPAYPRVIGLVTSPRGAAVHDVLRTLRRRWPLAQVKLAGVPVEGRTAPAALACGIQKLEDAGCEVILVVRGGGSFEDLMPFNDEGLARAIAACPVPVVTGIGHEPDTTIADMVADVRASTPTAAAETAAPSASEIQGLLDSFARAMTQALCRRLGSSEVYLRSVSSRPLFSDPMHLLSAPAQAVDVCADRLFRALPDAMERDGLELSHICHRMLRMLERSLADPARLLASTRERISRAAAGDVRMRTAALAAHDARITAVGTTLLNRFRAETGVAAARLHDLSPLAVLARGYAIVQREEGDLVRSVQQVEAGSAVKVMLSDGLLRCDVKETARIDMDFEEWEDASCRK